VGSWPESPASTEGLALGRSGLSAALLAPSTGIGIRSRVQNNSLTGLLVKPGGSFAGVSNPIPPVKITGLSTGVYDRACGHVD
jgi:hypothetical protein